MDGNSTQGVGIRSWFQLDTLPISGVLLCVFLVPLFFIPTQFLSLQFSKSIFVTVCIVLSLSVYLISLLKRGSCEVSRSTIHVAGFLVIISTLLSTLLSGSFAVSFLGYGFETDTLGFLTLMFVLFFLVSVLFSKENVIVTSYLLFFTSIVALSLFHGVRFIFGADVLFGSFFADTADTLAGNWYDLSVLYGATLILSLITIEMFPLRKLYKYILYTLCVLSLLFLTIVNFNAVWIVLSCFALVFFVFFFSFERVSNDTPKTSGSEGEIFHITKKKQNTRRISVVALLVLFISLALFLPLGNVISNELSATFNVSVIQVRPSWGTTVNISKQVLAENLVFGVGPNRFFTQWQLFKPVETNITPFWNSSFNSGVGFIPTLLSTTGIFGFLMWILFLGCFVYVGFLTLFARGSSTTLRYFTTSSFFVALYFWVMLVLYTPTISIIVLTFFFSGLFLAVVYMHKLFKTSIVTFSAYPRASFAFVLAVVFLIIAALAFGYVHIQKVVSAYYFERATTTFSQGNNSLDQSEAYFLRSISLYGADVYYRQLTQLYLARIGVIVSEISGQQASEELTREFERLLNNAVVSANSAIEYDPENHENWAALGFIHASALSLGAMDFYENAKEAYQEAILRSPKNPQLYLILARIETLKKDFTKAKEYVSLALSIKQNYADAIFFKSQLEVNEGNIPAAIESVERITLLSPNEVAGFFELGLLKYHNSDFRGASVAFERAVTLVSDYANARYFLGLSYNRLNRDADAIVQFENILRSNPDNTEVRLILSNLQAGREPFQDVIPPIDNEPENRDELPISEGN